MERESSSLHSQETATCPYPEPDQSSPCPQFYCLKIHFNIILPSTPGSLFLRFPHQNTIKLSSTPFVFHAPPIIFFSILSPEQYLVRSTDNKFLVM